MKIINAKTKVQKMYFYFTWFIRLTLIIALIFEFLEQRWTLFFVTFLALVVSFVPAMFERRYKIFIPLEAHLFMVLFIYAGIYLGEVQKFYDKYWWWDSILHTSSGFALGIIGFLIMYVLFKCRKISASAGIIAILSFCFALSIGTIWEIFEFIMDNLFNLNMQKTHIGRGVTDTMYDLILDSIGALASSIAGYFYLKKGDSRIYNYFLTHFEKNNPKLFKRRR
jgi:signal transduction histidine kinase